MKQAVINNPPQPKSKPKEREKSAGRALGAPYSKIGKIKK
jgi:hypothetical protein